MSLKAKKFTKEFILVTSLILAIVAIYTTALKFPYFQDLTQRHTLSKTTQSILTQCKHPVELTLYSQNIDTHHQIKILIEHYQLFNSNIQFHWEPHAFNEENGSFQALVVQYGDQQKIINLDIVNLDENQLTSALFKLHRKSNQWVVFLQGHDEPSPFASSNRDYQLFRLALENQGLKVQQLNLHTTPFIPENTQVLIIAAPKSTLMPKEEELIANFIANGKDVLWLIDPHSPAMPLLNNLFEISPLPGTIVDLHGQHLGTPHPAITIIDQYPLLPFQAPQTLSAFPWSVALSQYKHHTWQSQPLLITHELTWTHIGDLNGKIAFDPEKEVAGPLLLGLSLTRTIANQQQRVVIIGNSRFLSNGAIENYGNLAFGLGLLNWLNHDDMLIEITHPVSQDTMIQIHLPAALAIQYGFPLLPVIIFIISMIFFYLRSRNSRPSS